MIQKPMDVLQQHPIRKSKKQKRAFRRDVRLYAQKLGYDVHVEQGRFGVQNLVIGDAAQAKILVTAHYDTPASIGLPNFITPNNPLTFFLIQFLLVGVLLGVSIALAFSVYLLTESRPLMLLSWYVLYFGLLALMIFGPANRSNANDNTSGVVTVLEILTSLPENLRHKAAFVLFDLEEAGLLGSACYRKAHKLQTDQQLVLNLDCVGDGDVIQLAPVKKARQDQALLAKLEAVCGPVGKKGKKQLRLRARGFTAGSSDHKNFPKGVGIMAFHDKKGIGLYCGRIHTWRDRVLEYSNINILRAALISLISS